MTATSTIPDFCQGIKYFGGSLPEFDKYAGKAAIAEGKTAIIAANDPNAIYQTLLAADALRYLTLQITATKESGHPGGFASAADVIASLMMLGQKNIFTEVGHHAPGFYSNVFLDRSLEAMGISNVRELGERFREKHGLLGHLSGQIPGLLGPAGPLGQGQHFAMAAAKLHPNTLFPVTIGDGGLGEPYIMSSFGHFHTAYPEITNFLPILVWNGYSQEHHSMVSLKTNAEMEAYWRGNGFEEVILINAKDFDDANQNGEYVDSTKFSFNQRLEFMKAVLMATDKAAQLALGGQLTVIIIKQLKGAGVHKRGAASHNLYPGDSLEKDYIVNNINVGLKIIHPTSDDTYFQAPNGQVYEPLSEDACAGLAVGLSLLGARTLWCSYESFAINGLPIWQTVTQAMAELRRPTPSTITLFTAGALEQGRNGWTHQRPEIENYFAAMMRNGNIFPLFPCDANSIQVCYEWALGTSNKGITITASKSPLPVRTTFEQTRQALEKGGVILHESEGSKKVVFAVIGDMTLLPVFESAQQLEAAGIGVKIVSVINPRRLYRPSDVMSETSSAADNNFLDDAGFDSLFAGDALIGVTGGTSAMLEPIMLRSNARRDVFAWKRGETTASAGEIMAYNELTKS